MEQEFAGRVAWVTGAAGALGAAVARALLASGATAVLSGRTADALAAARDALAPDLKGRAHVAPMDLTRQSEVEAVARGIEEAHGRVDFLVNCTAVPTFGDFLDLSDAAWEGVLDAKLMGYIRTMRCVLPGMARRGFGGIVNLSGRGGRQPTPAHLPGACANAAVNVLTKGLADIYGRHGIRINAVAPGPIESPRFAEIAARNDEVSAGAGQKSASVPLGRLGRPEDVANAVLFLLSERSGFTTGVSLQVDGGGMATV